MGALNLPRAPRSPATGQPGRSNPRYLHLPPPPNTDPPPHLVASTDEPRCGGEASFPPDETRTLPAAEPAPSCRIPAPANRPHGGCSPPPPPLLGVRPPGASQARPPPREAPSWGVAGVGGGGWGEVGVLPGSPREWGRREDGAAKGSPARPTGSPKKSPGTAASPPSPRTRVDAHTHTDTRGPRTHPAASLGCAPRAWPAERAGGRGGGGLRGSGSTPGGGGGRAVEGVCPWLRRRFFPG